jgi:cytochrome c-type biogenesis protein CcmH/NrfG
MAARFCPQCGIPAVPKAKFCIDCGAGLAGGGSARSATWQLTTAGAAVFGFFVVTGLAIWTLILQPTPPQATPARSAGRASEAPAVAQNDLPPDHPKVPLQLPAEVKTFIDDLSKKASADPKDLATWSRLAQVYYRTAQVDQSYYEKAKAAFSHVLELDPQNAEALRGLGSVHFELDEAEDAIAVYERYLKLKPDDETTRTALAAAHLSAGDAKTAITMLRDVIAKKPEAWPAHYYLGIALDQEGDRAAGLASVEKARELATDDSVRAQIDQAIARMGGEAAPGEPAPGAAPSEDSAPRSPFQRAVEQAFRAHQIMGPRIVRFEWSAPGSGRVVVQNFPMSGMPDEVKQKFTGRLSDTLRDAAHANDPGGPVKIDIADATSGEVMATVVPSPAS